MGYQLWVSPLTGERRHGTDFVSLKKIFMDSVTAKSICEPLHSCKPDMLAREVKDILNERDFDTAGVIDENEKVIGYVVSDELEDGFIDVHIKNIDFNKIVSDSTPIPILIDELTRNEYLYVNYGRDILFIVTKADLNKPPVRIFIFGVISLFEIHLNYWVRKFYKNDDEIRAVIDTVRFENANAHYQVAKGNNENDGVNLVGYLQLSDKKKLLCSSSEFCKTFNLSKNKMKGFVEAAEKIRNNIAHSQNSIFTGITLELISILLGEIEDFIVRSEELSSIKN